MIRRSRFSVIAAILITTTAVQNSKTPIGIEHGTFHVVASYQGLGSLTSAVVASGPGDKPRIYATYMYFGHTVDLVAIDPATGEAKVYNNPAPSEYGAVMALGPDGEIYLGTRPHAHFLRFYPRTGAYTDLGRPAPSESYIWDLALGTDGKMYGCTYPSAKLVRLDPATGVSEDLGVMDPDEQYVRWIAASDDGFIYLGTGFRHAGLIAFEIATGKHRKILPVGLTSPGAAVEVHRGLDGKVYASVGSQQFRIDGWTSVSIAASEVQPAEAHTNIDSNHVAKLTGDRFAIADDANHVPIIRQITYGGRAVPFFRLGAGPDGNIYAGTILPFHFVRVSPEAGALFDLGLLGGGEPYSLVSSSSKLFVAAYSGLATLMAYDPSKPVAISGEATTNPALFRYEGADHGWRPQALVFGPDGAAYIGAVAGYGKLGGPLARLEPASGRVEIFDQIVKDESVVSLAASDGLIIGGTTIEGGGGSRPIQTEAKLFVWDIARRSKVFETVPVSHAHDITDLIFASNGLVYGIAGGTTLFAFDVAHRRVTFSAILPFNHPIYNSVAVGTDGNIWGLAEAGIFTIDPATNIARLVAKAPHPITAGFALVGSDVFFGSDNVIYDYRI